MDYPFAILEPPQSCGAVYYFFISKHNQIVLCYKPPDRNQRIKTEAFVFKKIMATALILFAAQSQAQQTWTCLGKGSLQALTAVIDSQGRSQQAEIVDEAMSDSPVQLQQVQNRSANSSPSFTAYSVYGHDDRRYEVFLLVTSPDTLQFQGQTKGQAIVLMKTFMDCLGDSETAETMECTVRR
jgi:hypothetical protein